MLSEHDRDHHSTDSLNLEHVLAPEIAEAITRNVSPKSRQRFVPFRRLPMTFCVAATACLLDWDGEPMC